MNSFPKISDELLSNVEFIQTINVDINGLARGKMFPREKLVALLEGREEIVNVVNILGSKCEIPFIKDLSDGFENTNIVLDKDTLQIAPWCEDNSLAIVFYDIYDINTYKPTSFNPRLLAKLMLKELEDYGYKLLIGVENEFRIFDKATMEPLTKSRKIFDQFFAASTLLPFMKKLSKKLKIVDIEIDSWNMEYGKGQIEIPLRPYIGMEGLDKVWLFREITKYVAHDMNQLASYMTDPLFNDASSGMHINHSLLRSLDLVNVLKSEKNDKKLSEVGQYWLAGLLKHSRALTAITNPTINCYRRIRKGGFAPSIVSWNYMNRNVCYRVKTDDKDANRNYIENRNPSSSCNIYLAIAGMIAAGLDGIKNELSLPAPGNGDNCECLPISLKESLDALDKDVILREALGEKFVDWYIKAKMDCEVNEMNNVDLEKDIGEQEFEKYIFL